MRWVAVLLFSLAVLGCKSEKRKDFALICSVRMHVRPGAPADEERQYLEANVKTPEAKEAVKAFYTSTDPCNRGPALRAAAEEAGVSDCPLANAFGECSGPKG